MADDWGIPDENVRFDDFGVRFYKLRLCKTEKEIFGFFIM